MRWIAVLSVIWPFPVCSGCSILRPLEWRDGVTDRALCRLKTNLTRVLTIEDANHGKVTDKAFDRVPFHICGHSSNGALDAHQSHRVIAHRARHDDRLGVILIAASHA